MYRKLRCKEDAEMNRANRDLKTRYENYREIIRDFTIMDDTFMRNVLKKKECTEHVLQVILNRKDLRVIDQVIQMDYKNLQGRSLIMDCVASDQTGRRFDVEIQQENAGASPRRARYHAGLLDMNTLEPGDEFEKIPESYVIFITREDALKYGCPIYHVERTVKEAGTEFGDGSHIIYVDSSRHDDTELGQLMHDFTCKEASKIKSKILADRVRELKETQEGVEQMNQKLEELYYDGVEQGIQEGEERTARKISIELAKEGMSAEQIAKIVNADLEKVQWWIKEKRGIRVKKITSVCIRSKWMQTLFV